MPQDESSQSRRLDRLEKGVALLNKSVADLNTRMMKVTKSEDDLVKAVTALTDEINTCLAQLAADASVIKQLTAAQTNVDPQFETAATSIMAQVTRLQAAIASAAVTIPPSNVGTDTPSTNTPPKS